MTELNDWLAAQFEAKRAHLQTVAYRMLGSRSEADDAVQEAWLRLIRSDASEIENLGGWLTTVVARVCLDVLRSRTVRREEALEDHAADALDKPSEALNPEQEALLADSIGPALLLVLDRLNPAERLVFVLHDMFAVPFEEIAPIVGKSLDAARKLASRARKRVQGASTSGAKDRDRQREIVAAFFKASREGNFDALLGLLDPNVVAGEVRGAQAVAETFKGRARGAQLALIDGVPGAVWMPGGKPRVVFAFTIVDDKIVAIDLVGDPERLRQLDVKLLKD